MSEGFRGQESNEADKPKEVKPVSEGLALLRAQSVLKELKDSGMSHDEAFKMVVEHTGVDEARFKAWLESLKNNSAPLPVPPSKAKQKTSKYTPEEIQDMWFNRM